LRLARRWSRIELLNNTLECKGKGLDFYPQGVCLHDIFRRVTDANSNTRLAPSPKQIAFASSQHPIADRERLYPSSNASPLIPPHTRSAINRTHTRCIPSIPSLSALSFTHHLRTLPSLIIGNHVDWIPLFFQHSYQCTERTSSIFPSRPSARCSLSMLPRRSLSFKYSVWHSGCSTNTGITAFSPSSCSWFSNVQLSGRYVKLAI
jgi:hypothetical protein